MSEPVPLKKSFQGRSRVGWVNPFIQFDLERLNFELQTPTDLFLTSEMDRLREPPSPCFKTLKSNTLSLSMFPKLSKRKFKKWKRERKSILELISLFQNLTTSNDLKGIIMSLFSRYQFKIAQSGQPETAIEVSDSIDFKAGGCYVVVLQHSLDESGEKHVSHSYFHKN